MDRFKNWSTLEFALLAGVILLICAIGVVVVLLAGGFLVEREIAQQPGVPSPGISDAPTPIVAPGEEGAAAEDTKSITLSTASGEPGTVVTVSGEGWPAGSRVVVSLVPSEPPPYVVNSAVVNENGSGTNH